MGIYSNGQVYGLKWYYSDRFDVILEKIYEEEMTYDDILQVKETYDNITNFDNLSLWYYTKCSSTYGDGEFMSWFTIDKNGMDEWFKEEHEKYEKSKEIKNHEEHEEHIV